MKVLFAGEVRSFAACLRKVTALCTPAPFDLLFITHCADMSGLRAFIDAGAAAPLPIFFLAPGCDSPPDAPALGVHFLGTCGRATVGGLAVVFADGSPETRAPSTTPHGTLLDMSYLTQSCRATGPSRASDVKHVVDVLLTPQTPAGFLARLPADAVPPAVHAWAGSHPSSSMAVTELAQACAPRYHVCCGATYFHRLPYSNAYGPATRLVILAAFDDASDGKGDAKNLHALNLVPAATMEASALGAPVPNCTASPYTLQGCEASAEEVGIAAPAAAAAAKLSTGAVTAPVRFVAAGGVGAPPAARTLQQPIMSAAARAAASAALAPFGAGGDADAPGELRAVKRMRVDELGTTAAGNNGSITANGGAASAALSSDRIAQLTREVDAAAAAASNQYFWNVRGGGRGGRGGAARGGAYGGHDAHRDHTRRADAGGAMMQERRPPPECWFCLASPKVEKHLVVSIGAEAYLALPKGGVDDTHVLIVPIQHQASLATAPAPLLAEIDRFLGALARFYASKGLALVAFERVLHARRGETPMHTHLQVMGVPAEAATKAESTFVTEGAFRSVPFARLSEGETLLQAVSLPGADAVLAAGGAPGIQEYLYVEVPTGPPASADIAARPPHVRLLHKIPPGTKHPVQFGRELLCRMLVLPQRLHWKECALSVEGETAQTEAFRAAFTPFDFTSEL